MNRFERVVQILETAVGGLSAPTWPHRAFWRDVTRDEFVAKVIFGLPLIAVGDGAASILVKALKGETPFGAGIGNPDADFNRMHQVDRLLHQAISRLLKSGSPKDV